jgi:phosphoribosylglycinamide formyltransferase-1
MKNIVVLISGRGSNLAALLGADIPARFSAVISNRLAAQGLAVAKAYGVATEVLDHRQYPDRTAFDSALASAIDAYAPDLVVLAGFMRILSDGFVNHYAGRLMNIHPSLLPAFPGLNTHQRALAAGVKIHGCSVHFVTRELDHGPLIAQAAVPVYDDDDEATLAARVLQMEHQIYPMAVRWFVEERLKLSADGVVELIRARRVEAGLISPEGEQ